jgi:DNA repair exonuclease SbcCD nuclease subunit
MLFITLGDIHINQNMPFSNKLNNRLETELIPALVTMLEYASENNIKTIVLTGDLFHSVKITPQEFKVFRIFLNHIKRLNIKVYYVAGQHEMDEEGNSILSEMNRLEPNIRRVKDSHYVSTSEVSFFFADYCHTIQEFKERIKLITKGYLPIKNRPRILIAHQAVKGAWFKHTQSLDGIPPEWFSPTGRIGKNFDLCLFGDFHLKQPLPFNKGIYTGSFTQNDFKDEGNPTEFHIVDTETLEIKSIDVKAPKFHTIKILKEKEISLDNINNGDYVRIVLTGTSKFVKNYKIKELVNKIAEEVSPKRISVVPSVITDKHLPGIKKVRRDESDEELVQRIIKERDNEAVPDNILYQKGIYYFKEARKAQ